MLLDLRNMVRRRISNAEIARALDEMALYLEMDEVPFKPQAYRKAAYSIASLDRPAVDLYLEGGGKALSALPGIGNGIARRIAGFIETGKVADLESLRKTTPVDILSLTALEGIGPKKARALWQGLEVKTIADLKKAAQQGRIRSLPRFGKRSEEKILQAIAFHEQSAGRRPLAEMLEIARRIEEGLAGVPGVEQVVVAGSIRRRRETIGDVDVLVSSEKPAVVSKAFETQPTVQSVHARGPTKTLVRLVNGTDADLRVIAPESFGAALMYFTGSKAHNVALRKIALRKKLKLNEYGLFRGQRSIASRTEEEIYRALGLSWIAPEMREDTGEVELASRHQLPSLVEPADIRGDLQVHSSWTDGTVSIETMARSALALGREYIAITDHTRDLAMTGGLDESKLLKQIAEVRTVDHELDGIRVLTGAEVNIREDGTLDIRDNILAMLDVVGAAIHSHFDQGRAAMTQRVIRAIENPNVDILFHPMSRALGRRPSVELDFDAVIEACLRTNTVLEIDSQPERLDLADSLARRAVEAGVRIAIDSDAHNPEELRFIDRFGLGVARRAWVQGAHVINALPVDEMLSCLKDQRTQLSRNARAESLREGAREQGGLGAG